MEGKAWGLDKKGNQILSRVSITSKRTGSRDTRTSPLREQADGTTK
jgi:hypothetical protein